LLIYDFSTNYCEFSKFTEKRVKAKLEIEFRSQSFAESPLNKTGASQIGPWPDQNRGGTERAALASFLVARVAGGGGPVGEKGEGAKPHLWRV
jgi:hypothetical protein